MFIQNLTQAILVTSSFISFLILLLFPQHLGLHWNQEESFLTRYIQNFHRQIPRMLHFDVLTLAPPLLPQLSIRLDTLPPVPSLLLAPSSPENPLSLLHPKKRKGLLGRKITVHIFKEMSLYIQSGQNATSYLSTVFSALNVLMYWFLLVSNTISTKLRPTELTVGLKCLVMLWRSV